MVIGAGLNACMFVHGKWLGWRGCSGLVGVTTSSPREFATSSQTRFPQPGECGRRHRQALDRCVCVCVLVKTLTVASARRTDIPPHKAVVAQSSEGSGAKGESESPLRLLITLPPTVWSAPLHPCATSSRCWASRKQLSVKWAGRVFGLARLACPVAA
jgi:hypothetical protein